MKGTIRAAKGWLGAFELTVDDYAQPAPSSRDALTFGAPRNGAVSKCDIVLDLSGGASLFPAADLRDGYLRADPGDPAAMLRAVMKARDLTGTFDKPRYVTYDSELCAHSRSRIVGCRRCLDLCPTGAITPAGDHVAIIAEICAGCGQCAAVCPTGAASYALPPADVLMRKLRTLLMTYREAGGRNAVMLLHDDEHGTELIDALARHGDGLPANVIPLAVNEITQVGLEAIAAAFAYGAAACAFCCARVRVMTSPACSRTIALADPILAGTRLRRRARRHHRNRRSRCAWRSAARDRSGPAASGACELPSGRRQARRAAARAARTASRRAAAGRRDRAAAGRAIRRDRSECRRLHAVSRLRVGLPDRRDVGRSRPADAEIHRRCLRAMRAVRGDLPGEGDHADSRNSTSAPPLPHRAS